MNRTLKRPMFRIGGSTGTGITSGLDQPQKMANGGRTGYQQGSMPNFQMGGLPGFLTGFGLNLLATPPQGNIFQTAATAAQDPFNRLQASQAASMKTASDRKFARELAQEEREFEEKQLGRRLAVEREKIGKMGGTDITKRLEAAREEFGDDIKAARAVEFGDTKFKEFEDKFGEGQVATTVIDSDGYQRKGSLEKFVKQNPRVAGLKIYDVATNKVVVIVTDTATGRLKLIPADSADIDTTGDTQPTPRENPGLFGQPTKPGRELKEILPDFRDSGFDEDFYQ